MSQELICAASGAIPIFHSSNQGDFLAINCLKTSTPQNKGIETSQESCFIMTSPFELAVVEGKALSCNDFTGPIRCLVTKGIPSGSPAVIVNEIYTDKGLLEVEADFLKQKCLFFVDSEIAKYKSVFPDGGICFLNLEHNLLRISVDFENWKYVHPEKIKSWASGPECDMIDLRNGHYLLITKPVQKIINILIKSKGAFFFSLKTELKEYIMKRLY